ncbi:MAG TPA: Flp pilus assembly protein CpaB [Bryobacteraceae bacterium]|nr:Flp pilus assembly protein CpaB [Bryobacteraceae bacterium]
MNQRFISVLVFAFVVAGCASLLLYRLTVSHASTQAAPTTTKALVASRNLELGAIIKDTDVKDVGWSGALPTNAVLKREDIIGRGVTTTIYDGEPIMENRLAPKGAGGGLAAMIPSGMRAVAVRVNDVVGVAGFVVPGMRVDILISGNPPGPNSATQGSQTRTLLQNIEVLSAGQDFKKDNEGKPLGVGVVNLLVTPEQAEMLSLASNQTTIQLVLRNPLDTQMAKTSGTAVVELFANNGPRKRPEPTKVYVKTAAKTASAPPPPLETRPAPPVRQTFVMEVINGTKRSESKFDTTPEVK